DVTIANERGLEFLVLSGSLVVGDDTLAAQSWGRLPAAMPLRAAVGRRGARLWMKDGALLHRDVCTLPD
ncbi:MAG: cupin, partial [Gammaproteobacteria bacterium]